MLVYIVKNSKLLSPFQKPASEMRVMRESLGQRLRRQLGGLGVDVQECKEADVTKPAPRSLVIYDDVLLSEHFLKRLLAKVEGKSQDLQLWMDSSKFALFTTRDAPAQFKALPIYYFGDKPHAQPMEKLEFIPDIIYDTNDGLSQEMGDFKNMHLYCVDAYAVHVKYWFDFFLAINVYLREYLTEKIRPLRKILPKAWVYRLLSIRWGREYSNKIGKNCKIHKTAVLEACIIGDNVEIGPYCYLQSAIIADNAVLTEFSAVKLGYVGERSWIGSCEVINSYVGAGSFVHSTIANVVFGDRVFIAGGSGFSDYISATEAVTVSVDGENLNSGHIFLGSAVGDDVNIGPGLAFIPGRTLPRKTIYKNAALIREVPTTEGLTYVALDGNLTIDKKTINSVA